jgi:heterodisulfide reductase subunit B
MEKKRELVRRAGVDALVTPCPACLHAARRVAIL